MTLQLSRHSVLTLGLLLATASPAIGQPIADDLGDPAVRLRIARQIERDFAAVETARTAGICLQRDRKLAETQIYISRLATEASQGRGFGETALNEYFRRLSEAWARPCPPPGPVAPPPPPVSVLPPTGTAPPTPDPGFEDRLNARLRTAYTETIERLFATAERLRLEGQCEARQSQLFNIGDHIGVAGRNGAFTDEATAEWHRRLDEVKLRPCPPTAPPPPPPPPPVETIPDLRTGDAGPVRRDGAFQAVSLSVGYASLEIPRANYAFVSDGPVPAPDVPAAYSVRRPAGVAFEARLDTGRFGVFTIDYAQADASNRTEIPAGAAGTRRGYPYTAISPSGSTGLGGNIPIEVDTNEQVDAYRMNWSMRFGAEPPAEVLEELRARLNARAGVTLSYRDRDHLGVTSITTPVIATQTLEQDVDELEIGVSAGVDAIIPLGGDVRLTLGARAGLYYFDFDLRSVETNTQNFGPAADRAFTTELRDAIGDIGYHGDAFAELSVDLSQPFELFVRGRASYYSDRAQVLNPFSGTSVQNGETARLGTERALDWSIMLGGRISFD